MGHQRIEMIGVGSDRDDALSSARYELRAEYGRRYEIREVESEYLLRKIPPLKEEQEKISNRYERTLTYIRQVEDPTAPQDRWREEWKFVFHTHT